MLWMIESNEKEGDNRGDPATPPPTPQPTWNSDSSNKWKKFKKIKIYIDSPNFWISSKYATWGQSWVCDALHFLLVLVEHTRFWRADPKCDVTADVYGEKEVDTSLVADAVAGAIGDRDHDMETEFVIVSSDRDMLPAVNKIMDCKFRVYVWSWNWAVSAGYERLHKEHEARPFDEKLFTLYRLNDFINHFAYRQL
ncbi:hypothetical protein BHE90_017118 [Fusarium euwallaceae]|uniref:NYN domain-containing protein n=1 Tax=Fusarium euwallaceae TaxID=1147111 RepID=A0A430KYD2_9HYPO|nr:hypothetical protein BHE90_017118 [Fusarium euwallaceae]